MNGAWTPARVAELRSGFYDFLNYVSVSSKETGKTILGENLYRAQTIFYETVFEGLAADCHEFLCLKSRQLGISTSTRALTLFWLGMHGGLRGALVFDSAFNTAAARREIEETLDNLPKKLGFPGIKSRNRDALILSNDSWLLFLQAGTRNSRAGGGLGRSLGLSMCHASEISSWANTEGIKSFRQSLAEENPNRLFIWESTARGYEIWFDLWQEAKQDPYTKQTVFLGWHQKNNQIWARDTVEFSIYGAEPPNKREQERIKAVKELYGWDITPEQLAWYRWKTDPSREIDEDDAEDSTLIQEQPWTEDEAFQQTGSSFFMSEKLSAASSRLASEPRPQTFRFWPGLDFVTSDIKPARTKREVEFQMWEEPKPDSWYVVAADPAFGHNENNNNSAAQVLRCYADAIEQVGEYASATIQPHQFVWLLWTLIGYYGSSFAGCRVNFICEINGPGEEVWRQFQVVEQLVRQGYLRQAAKEKGIGDIFANVSRYIYTRSDSMNAGSVWQWKTNQQNKVQIMEACRNYLHNDTMLVRSMDALDEMRTITRDGDTIGAEGAKRDDRTFALALGVRAWDEKIRRTMIAQNRTREAERAKVSLTMEDRAALWSRNTLQDFFHRTERARIQQHWASQRAGWRQAIGVRRPPAGRRW